MLHTSAIGIGNLVVTMGADGALVLTSAGAETVPSVPVKVVDSTGAGDAFNSGLAVALAVNKPLAEAVRYANCAGAIACTKLGVIPSLGTQAHVDQFCAEHYE